VRSLYWKLGAALLLIVAVSVGLTAYLANVSTERQFQSYMQQGNTMYARNLSDTLSQYYIQNQSWSSVQSILTGLLRSSSERLLVANNSGLIVGDSENDWLGKNTGDVGLTNGTSIMSSGQSIGTLYILTDGMGSGRGFMGGRGGSSSVTTATPEQTFLSGINKSLIIAGLIAAAVALLLGLFLTRQILKPIRVLTDGARHIAAGDLKYRAAVKSQDEIGTLAQSFNSMASSLELSEEARRQLNADIAHELRTPLTIIEGTVDGILDGVFLPDKEHLNTIKGQTALLTRLISDLRDLSLIESGQLKLEFQLVDLADLIRRKITQIDAAAREKSIRLNLNLPDGLPKVYADPTRMEQVLSNLLTNAVRHTPQGGTITSTIANNVNGIAGRAGGHYMLVSVQDTGEGISTENLPHIFERFYRVDSARSRTEGGTGLGLAIVKQIVEAHNGIVWAESNIGKGSTFYIALPVKEK
jgi:two-component system OmpR family sensor kinase